VAAEVNYFCVRIGHASPVRYLTAKWPITGAVQGGKSVTHSIADSTRNWCFDSGRFIIAFCCPRAEPRYEAEITYADITDDGMVQHPSFKALVATILSMSKSGNFAAMLTSIRRASSMVSTLIIRRQLISLPQMRLA
jgi:hypothetical protein